MYRLVTEQIIEMAAPIVESRQRTIIAVCGPPAAGKSTIAEAVVAEFNRQSRFGAVLMPMDGYHLDNAILEKRGLLARKGAPETFAATELLFHLQRIKDCSGPVYVPLFDRQADLARAHARLVGPESNIIVVEGNYLLLKRPVWRELRPLFDLTVSLTVAESELEKRLIDRWLHFGLDRRSAENRARQNDIVNARVALEESAAADLSIEN